MFEFSLIEKRRLETGKSVPIECLYSVGKHMILNCDLQLQYCRF